MIWTPPDTNPIKARMRKHLASKGIEAGELGARTSFNRVIEYKQVSNGTSPVFEIGAMATTDDVDQDQEVVLPEGCDWSVFERIGKHMYADHWYGIENRVGLARSWALRPNGPGRKGWFMTSVIRRDPDYPMRGAIIEAALESVVGLSIGFEKVDGSAPTPEESKRYPGVGYVIRKAKIFEVSFTFMPCNINCVSASVASVTDKHAERVAEWAVKSGRLRGFEELFSVPRRKRVVVLG